MKHNRVPRDACFCGRNPCECKVLPLEWNPTHTCKVERVYLDKHTFFTLRKCRTDGQCDGACKEEK